MIVALRAPSLAKFREVDTVPVSPNDSILIVIICMGICKSPYRSAARISSITYE